MHPSLLCSNLILLLDTRSSSSPPIQSLNKEDKINDIKKGKK